MAMVRTVLFSLVIMGTLFMTACDTGTKNAEIIHRHTPTDPVAGIAVTTVADQLHMAWVEKPAEGSPRIYHSISHDGGRDWSNPVQVESGRAPPDRVRRDNDLQLVASGDALLVAWQTRGDGFMGSGPMAMARSSDNGLSWQKTTAPATTDDAAAQGFFALSNGPDERVHMAWLDNRGGQQGLHYAVTADQGQNWSEARTLQDATCQCCWNSLAHNGETTYVLYRQLAPRDMALMASVDTLNWQDQGVVGQFDWDIDGCPHVGGALATPGDNRLHALVWTGRNGYQGLYHLFRDEQRSQAFSAPRRLGTRAARHGDLAATPQGNLLAAWDEMDTGSILTAWYQDGSFTEPKTLRASDSKRPQRPLLAVIGELGYVVWTEQDSHGRATWVMARVRYPD